MSLAQQEGTIPEFHPLDLLEQSVEDHGWPFERSGRDELNLSVAGRWCAEGRTRRGVGGECITRCGSFPRLPARAGERTARDQGGQRLLVTPLTPLFPYAIG